MQLEFFDVPSPCIGICQLSDKGQCLGCFRTREERQVWTSINSDEKQKIIKRCIQRKKRAEKQVIAKVAVEEEKEVIQPSLLDQPQKSTLDTSTNFDFDDFEL